MLLVRKTLTEILLEVTDDKIQEISKETLSRYKRKGSCAIEHISLSVFQFNFLLTNTQKKKIQNKNCAKFKMLRDENENLNQESVKISIDAYKKDNLLFLY